MLATRPLQAAWSRFATFRCLPDSTKDREQAVTELRDLLRRIGNRPIVILAGAIEAATLAQHYDEFEPFAELCISRKDTIDLVLDNRAFNAWTRHHGFNCPATAAAAAEHMPFDPPFAVKPTNYSIMLCNHQCFQQGPDPLGFKFRRIWSMADWRDFRDRQRTWRYSWHRQS